MSDKKKTRLRFLHCGDIHLDTPFVGLSAEKSEERRRMLRASFVKGFTKGNQIMKKNPMKYPALPKKTRSKKG